MVQLVNHYQTDSRIEKNSNQTQQEEGTALQKIHSKRGTLLQRKIFTTALECFKFRTFVLPR